MDLSSILKTPRLERFVCCNGITRVCYTILGLDWIVLWASLVGGRVQYYVNGK